MCSKKGPKYKVFISRFTPKQPITIKSYNHPYLASATLKLTGLKHYNCNHAEAIMDHMDHGNPTTYNHVNVR